MPGTHRRWAWLLTGASGFAGLGYQVVWTQQHALWLGHEAAAVLAVVSAFFGGLAVGAFALAPRIQASPQPARWYAGCETLIALWSLAMVWGLAPVNALLLALTGPQPSPAWQWAVGFAGTFLALLPATAAMGATLPALERLLARWQGDASPLAGLYASNTLGAVVGVLATAFWLIPGLGLMRTVAVCAGVNLACAAGALALAGSAQPAGKLGVPPDALPPAPSAPSAPSAFVAVARPPGAQGLLWRLAATGLLGIGYEVLVVRALSQVAENTVYTLAILLAVYLVGSALGAAAWQAWGRRQPGNARLGDGLLGALALACLLGTTSLWFALPLQQATLPLLGNSMAAALTAEALLALAAFALPTALMGALFAHLSLQAGAAGIPWGRCLGVNTLGAAAAPALFGVALLPALGLKAALLLISAGYLALATPRAWRRPAAWATASTVAAVALWAPALQQVDVPEGGRITLYRDGAMAAVSVVEDASGVLRLRIDNHQQEGSSNSLLADARQALLPLLLHPAPQRALFLGLGTGVTASAASLDPSLQVDAAELLPEVIDASALFTQALTGASTGPRLRAVAADARRFVRAGGAPYDVIVSDNFHPARSGSGSLYTVEHFQAVRRRLSAQGVFCQWLPLHQLDLATLRSIVRSFQAAFPGGWAMLATHSLDTPVLGLLARADASRLDLASLRARLAHNTLPQALADYGIPDETALLGSFVAGPAALAGFAGDAPLNTDDHPVVAYMAPRVTYAPDSQPRDRLAALLAQLRLTPAQLLVDGSDAEAAARLAAYWRARDLFIAAGQQVRPSSDVRQMLAQVQAPLLDVLRTSPDFRPAYDPLLRMAGALARQDPGAARALLQTLASLQPNRPEAPQALLQMAGH